MKKHSKLTLGAFLAGVMIFGAGPVVSAGVVSGPYDIEGSITSMTGDGLVIDTAENETVRVYNTKIRTFPTNIIAGMFGFEKAAFFEVPKERQEAPKVKF